ncbi:MAG TPA: polyprenyl synthetase family protein [Bacteroidales bacterium]|nr:polyprenyl synthetase family protein [Bacteroidales bacterium]HPS62193.1 polyprenyl synthetase family protein [Bacteroidales bacterium]
MHRLPELHRLIEKAFSEAAFNRDPMQLYQPISYTLELGGKRLRPALVLLSCELFGGEIGKAIFPAMGVEIFHNFTLLHDDIMDNAPIRRGHPTVHRKWDINTAILSGDTMFVIAYEYVAKTDPTLLPAVLDLFNDTARKVCEGQQYDMDYETREDVTIDEYMIMIRLKTAVLIACSLKLGALVAGTEPGLANRIYDMGIELGLAFQLRDDYLDAFGEAGKFGKAIGGDIATNKKTYLYLKAFETARGETAGRLRHVFSDPVPHAEQKINTVIRLYKELGIDTLTRKEIALHHDRAMEILHSFGFNEKLTVELIHLMEEMLGREK